MSSRPHRAPAIVAIVVVLIAAWVVDNQVARPKSRAAADVQTPIGARPSAQSSAWFCPGATAASDGAANGTVVVANAGSRALNGTLTVFPSQGTSKSVNLSVVASGRTTVRLTDVLSAPYASAMVQLDGGAAVVELDGTGPLGETIMPCASNASTTWYFAEGVTTKDATEVITLFNPFPEDAVVDLDFTTEDGEAVPQALTGLLVPGQGMTAINVGDYVQRRDQVSARITARAGRLVAARLQTFDGSAGTKGVSLGLGAGAPGGTWYFPEGYLSDGLVERYQVYNPTNQEAKAEVDLTLEQGSAEPILLTVPPASRVTVDANDESRIPKGVEHAVVIRSTNKVQLVVERTILATSPATRAGVAINLGARITAKQWVVAAGQADDSNDAWLVLQNTNTRSTAVNVTLLDNGTPVLPPTLNGIELAAQSRRGFRLNDAIRSGATALLVTSDQPIVVEHDVYKVKGLGTAMAPAIPLRP